MPGTQQVDNKCHGNQECSAPFPAKDSPILFYSPTERRLQTSLTCHQTQPKNQKIPCRLNALCREATLLLIAWTPPDHCGVTPVLGGSCHQAMVSFVLDTAHPAPASERATGLSCGQGTSHSHQWLCLVLASSPHPTPTH